jgi:hypothetical protein
MKDEGSGDRYANRNDSAPQPFARKSAQKEGRGDYRGSDFGKD